MLFTIYHRSRQDVQNGLGYLRGALICNMALVVTPIFVGPLVFHESISMRTIIGIMVSIAGLLRINRR